MDVDLYLGARMLRRRHAIGMTQRDLAHRIGVSFQQVQKYECGATRLAAHRLLLIASALGVPVGYFFTGLDDLGGGHPGDSHSRAPRAGPGAYRQSGG